MRTLGEIKGKNHTCSLRDTGEITVSDELCLDYDEDCAKVEDVLYCWQYDRTRGSCPLLKSLLIQHAIEAGFPEQLVERMCVPCDCGEPDCQGWQFTEEHLLTPDYFLLVRAWPKEKLNMRSDGGASPAWKIHTGEPIEWRSTWKN